MIKSGGDAPNISQLKRQPNCGYGGEDGGDGDGDENGYLS
jgi:hypothetical protein